MIDNDPTFKSLEFLLYTHFAIYYLRPHQIHNDELARENMHVFKSYMEALKGQSLSQTSDMLPLFALPYVTAPEQHASFQDLFSVCCFGNSRKTKFFVVVVVESLLGTMVNCIAFESIEFLRLDFFQSITTESRRIITKW